MSSILKFIGPLLFKPINIYFQAFFKENYQFSRQFGKSSTFQNWSQIQALLRSVGTMEMVRFYQEIHFHNWHRYSLSPVGFRKWQFWIGSASHCKCETDDILYCQQLHLTQLLLSSLLRYKLLLSLSRYIYIVCKSQNMKCQPYPGNSTHFRLWTVVLETIDRVSSHEPSQNSLTFPWHFPDHFMVFPDHETCYQHFITALTLILQAIWQITHQK